MNGAVLYGVFTIAGGSGGTLMLSPVAVVIARIDSGVAARFPALSFTAMEKL